MRDFAHIIAIAADRKGGHEQLEAILAETPVKSPAAIAATPDDRILALMTKRIFAAGLNWRVIEAKWPGFETAFQGFDPAACAFMTDERFDELTRDASIVRNGAKIRAVATNAAFLLDLAREHGSAARFIADWPDSDHVGLRDLLKKRASNLGGFTASYFLRDIGKPAFALSPDVVKALIREGVVAGEPSGRKDMAAIQAAFNAWSAQSGRNLTEISRILAMSVAS